MKPQEELTLYPALDWAWAYQDCEPVDVVVSVQRGRTFLVYSLGVMSEIHAAPDCAVALLCALALAQDPRVRQVPIGGPAWLRVRGGKWRPYYVA